jgi:RNA polymerase sigma factor (sigma-70 family)
MPRERAPSTPPELASFCEEQWPRLVGTRSFLVGDAGAAEDLAQEALARACQHWAKVRHMDLPGVWLNRVAVNLARSHGRRESTRTRFARRAAQPDNESADPTNVMLVRAAVRGLPDRERLALVLRYFADLSVKDAAAVMGCAEGTVKYLTHSAIQRMRLGSLLDPEGADDARHP